MVAKKFKKLRMQFLENDLSQTEVAKAAGIAQSTLALRLGGKTEFRTGEIKRIAKVLNIPANEIPVYFFEGV